MPNSFQKLHPVVQKWVYKQGWKDLREIQQQSIVPILSGNTDVVISASTAAGKTEAAFLPACSAIADQRDSFGIVYISPLKALINDQYRRLEQLSDMLDMTVTPWHGDSLQSKKKKARRDPQGILLITPESLESLLIRESGWVKTAFELLQYIIIDEYHAFIGSERGFQLQSLMFRLESLLEREKPIPRIALSATLGDMDSVLSYLRPVKSLPCELIEGSKNHSTLKIQIRGYLDCKPDEAGEVLSADMQIAKDLYGLLRGDSHLVFANSRARTEIFAATLSDMCKEDAVPNEFFPHHGSLAKELRQELESRLQQENKPTTAVCTMTLELGIDIGKVKSVAQVTAPHSVASLRQRLGRSGRRGDPAILRMFIAENELILSSNVVDKLRIELLQSIAMIRLLLVRKWYEPAGTEQFHFSTLLHQILAVISQWGGVRADQLWALLCKSGSFSKVSLEHFKMLLTDMGEQRLITQLSSGELVIGDKGEKLVGHYTFYAVFNTPEEFRIIVNGKTLGTIPLDDQIIAGQIIIFAGRRWIIEIIDTSKKAIYVKAAKGGKPPKFSGGSMSVHDEVRQEMYQVYVQGDYRIKVADTSLDFLDSTAKELFSEGLKIFRDLNLKENFIISQGKSVFIMPWLGDKIVLTLKYLFIKHEYKSISEYGGIIEVQDVQESEVINTLKKIITDKKVTNTDLAEIIIEREVKHLEKYDYLLPEPLLNIGFGAKVFDVKGALKWITNLDL